MNSTRIKSIITIGLLGLNIVTLGFGPLALAQQTIANVPITSVGPKTVGGLLDLTRAVVKWVYILFFILAVLFILWAAFTYLMAAGDEDKVKKAKDRLIYAIVAIVVAFLAVGFETIIGTFLTAPNA